MRLPGLVILPLRILLGRQDLAVDVVHFAGVGAGRVSCIVGDCVLTLQYKGFYATNTPGRNPKAKMKTDDERGISFRMVGEVGRICPTPASVAVPSTVAVPASVRTYLGM